MRQIALFLCGVVPESSPFPRWHINMAVGCILFIVLIHQHFARQIAFAEFNLAEAMPKGGCVPASEEVQATQGEFHSIESITVAEVAISQFSDIR